VGNPARAADLAQDAIDTAYDDIAHLRDPAGFYPWLRRIATTRPRDAQRECIAEQERLAGR